MKMTTLKIIYFSLSFISRESVYTVKTATRRQYQMMKLFLGPSMHSLIMQSLSSKTDEQFLKKNPTKVNV